VNLSRSVAKLSANAENFRVSKLYRKSMCNFSLEQNGEADLCSAYVL